MTATTFVTDAGVLIPAVSVEQMREVDRIAIDEVGSNLFQMMENAGRSLTHTVLETLGPSWSSTPIIVLAGTGGNGGGGICAARHLANRGAHVTVVVSDRTRLTGVSGQQLGILQATNSTIATVEGLDELRPGLVVDAVIGYSLGGPPRDEVRAMIDWAGAQDAAVVSLDVPSGIDASSGEAPGVHVRASHTLTLALPKTGLDSPAAGSLELADIGIPDAVYRRSGIGPFSNPFGSRYRVKVRPE